MLIEQIWTGNAYRNFNYLIASKTSRIDKNAIIFDNYIKALNSRNFDLVKICVFANTLIEQLHFFRILSVPGMKP